MGPWLRELASTSRGNQGMGSRNLGLAFLPSLYSSAIVKRDSFRVEMLKCSLVLLRPRNEIIQPQKGGRKPWSSSATRTKSTTTSTKTKTTTKGKQKSAAAVSTNGGDDVANNNVVDPKISDGAPSRWWTSTSSSAAAARYSKTPNVILFDGRKRRI